MTDGRHFTDIYRERQERARWAADDRFRREAFNYRVLNDVQVFPRGRIIGLDDGYGGPYYGGRPQWYQTYWDRRQRAEEARLNPYGRALSYNEERARIHRERLAREEFRVSHFPMRDGQILVRRQMRNGDVHDEVRPNPRLREPATPLGNQAIQIADDSRTPNYRRIEGNLHDVRFVDGYTLDSRMLAGRLTTSVFHGGAEQFRVKKNPGGTVSEVSWNQEGQRYSLAYDVNTGGWQTFQGDRNEMRPIRGAGLDGWNIDNLDSRGRLHCSNGRPGEHMLIGRNLKEMIKLDQLEYDEYKRTGNLPDRWEPLDLRTPRRPRPVLA